MDFKTQLIGAGGLSAQACDALLVVLCNEAAVAALPAALGGPLQAALKDGDFAFKPGRTLYLHRVAGLKAERVAVAAAGDGSPAALRKALASGLAHLKGGGTRQLAVAMPDLTPTAAHAEALVAAVGEAVYVYSATKPSASPAPKLAAVHLLCSKGERGALEEGLARGRAISAGVTLAREWANRPGNHCTPTHLAKAATQLAKSHGLKVEVLERRDVEKLGMGAFLCVAQGSTEPLKFIVLRWTGAAKGDAPVVLVGKGITFDTGGISLKPGGEMDEMKFDMAGAASVLGTLRAVAELKLPLNVVGLIPSCENMPAGNAVKPGDVVTSLSGQTIEILNTDAEGRLILCDALTYAERFKPAAVIDIATLTGACMVSLGQHRSGLWSNDDPLFPATRIALGAAQLFAAVGIDRKAWASASPIRAIFKLAFEAAGLPYFHPHRFRSTLMQLSYTLCQTPEEVKAWSQNLGHEGVLTTFYSYGTVAPGRQGGRAAGRDHQEPVDAKAGRGR